MHGMNACRLAASLVVLIALGACGGGGGGGGNNSASGSGGDGSGPATPPTAPVAPPTVNAITLQSQAGDPIGLGKSYAYSSIDSNISVQETAGHLSITVRGDERWIADFFAPNATSPLQVGTYSGLPNTTVVDPTIGAFRWSRTNQGCNTSTSTVTIDQVSYAGNNLSSIILRFDRFCDGAPVPLHGELRWTQADLSHPPGVINPVPPGLWTPSLGSTPATGSYVLLQSDADDFVGLGQTHVYSVGNTAMTASGIKMVPRVTVSVAGSEQWEGTFQGIDSAPNFPPGYYPNVKGLPFYNPVHGGLSWIGEGRGCVALNGWFVIDRIVYDSLNMLSGIDLRFEQTCEGSTAVLHGAIHWDAPPSFAGWPPATLLPASSWHAPASAIPSTGNYLYVESGAGDFAGGGRTVLDTPSNAVFSVSANAGQLLLMLGAQLPWSGQFTAPTGSTELQVGVYDGLARPNQVNPSPSGSFFLFENGNACEAIRGWVVIDAVTYSQGALTAIDMRFEQACDSAPSTMKGQLHWTADDTNSPAGPGAEPTSLWKPLSIVPAGAGNYLHLEPDRGDFIGAGIPSNYTQADSIIQLDPNGPGISMTVTGDERWTMEVRPMEGLARLEAGYYPGVDQVPFQNPVKGGFAFYGINQNNESHACNASQSWYAIDNVSYVGNTLAALDMRFEQHCSASIYSAMRGSVHWTSNDPTMPPGPVFPAPQLWKPPAGATADTGTYVYLQSDPGDPIGNGQTATFTGSAAPIALSKNIDGSLHVQVGGAVASSGDFAVMSSRTRLELGYYGNLQGYPFNNPARGGLSWSMALLGCNTVAGWFIVDSVAYENGELASLDLRFEQHCGSLSPALRGRVRWQR